jgi:hypothetical protein
MSPAQATAFVARAVEAGVLWREGDRLRLAVDPASVDVPLGFRPRPDAQPEGRADAFGAWVTTLSAKRGQPPNQILEEVAARQAALGGHLTALAAVLWLAAEAGLDVRAEAARFRP